MRQDYPHNVTVILLCKSGAVVHAICDPCKISQIGRCSHVVAVLLQLSDYVKDNGYAVSTPCTSQECSWNKGKKREKNPKRLSEANYPSKRKRSQIKPIDFDPRPPKYRRINETHIKFFRNINEDCLRTGQTCMWTTQLKITYADYPITDTDVSLLEEKVEILYTTFPQH